jgi:hypothetical protein
MWIEFFGIHETAPLNFLQLSYTEVESGLKGAAYASVSGSAISGGTASEYGIEQISNISRFGRPP